MYINYFFIVALNTVTLYECCLYAGERSCQSLNKVTQLEHDRPLIENCLSNSGFRILSAMPCGFFSIKKSTNKIKRKQTKNNTIGYYGNEICVRGSKASDSSCIWAFLAGLERVNTRYRRYCFISRNTQAISASSWILQGPSGFESVCLRIVGAGRSACLHSFYSNDWIYRFGGCLKHLIKRKHISSKKFKKLFRTQRPFNTRNPIWVI